MAPELCLLTFPDGKAKNVIINVSIFVVKGQTKESRIKFYENTRWHKSGSQTVLTLTPPITTVKHF